MCVAAKCTDFTKRKFFDAVADEIFQSLVIVGLFSFMWKFTGKLHTSRVVCWEIASQTWLAIKVARNIGDHHGQAWACSGVGGSASSCSGGQHEHWAGWSGRRSGGGDLHKQLEQGHAVEVMGICMKKWWRSAWATWAAWAGPCTCKWCLGSAGLTRWIQASPKYAAKLKSVLPMPNIIICQHQFMLHWSINHEKYHQLVFFAQPDSYPSLVLIFQIFTLLVGQCGQCESLSSNQGLMLGIFTITLDPLSTYQDSGLQCNKLGPSYDELWPRTGHSPQLGCEIHGCATWNLVNSCCHVSHYISFLAFTEYHESHF